MLTQYILILSFLSIQILSSQAEPGARRVKFLNYPDCIELSNSTGTVIILSHHVGGRVLSYRQDGKESLFIGPDESEWTPNGNKKPSSAGRFDIGPEYLIPKRSELWSGTWEAKITGPGKARLISKESPDTGIRLIRDFLLDDDSSHLA